MLRLGAIISACAIATLAAVAPAAAQTTSVFGETLADVCAKAAADGRSDASALNDCEDALRLPRLSGPERAAILTSRGLIHLRRKDPEAALADFELAAKRTPNNADLMINTGNALAQLGRYGDAVVSFTSALQAGPTAPHKAFYNRGLAREQLGDLRGALEDYETALSIKPDWGPAEGEIARFVRGRRDALAQDLSNRPKATP